MSEGFPAIQSSRFVEPPGALAEPMRHSDGRGKPLLKSGPFGADLIRFPVGGGVPPHTHPGEHMLFVLSGRGSLQFGEEWHALEPGFCYHVPAGVRHAIRAESELTLLSVANDHRGVSAEDRLDVARD